MLSFSSILSDARNFISNNFTVILITVVILSIINQMINQFFYPNIETIGQIRTLVEQAVQQYGELSADTLSKTLLALSDQEKQQLVPIAMGYLINAGLVFLITNLIAMSVVLALIYTITYQPFSLNNLLQNITKIAPQVLLFMLLAVPGFIALSIIASILAPLAAPLGLLAVIFYLFTYIVFSAVIIEPAPQSHFMQKLKITTRFMKREIRLIIPMVGIWFLASFLLKTVADMLTDDNFIIEACFNILKLLLTVITVCYLYRLYSLSNKVLPYDTGY